MKKLTTILGISAFILAAACGGQEDAGMDEMDGMGEMEPSSQMMEADSMAADSMEMGMPEEMMDEGGEGMMEDEGAMGDEGAMDEMGGEM